MLSFFTRLFNRGEIEKRQRDINGAVVRTVGMNLGSVSTSRQLSSRNVSLVAAALEHRQALASAPLKAYRKGRDGALKHEPTSDLQRLLDKPNPFMTQSFLIERMIAHTLLAGNTYLVKNRGASGSRVLELWPMLPTNVEPIPDPDTWLAGYRVTQDGKQRMLSVDDVVHHQLQNPANPGHVGRGLVADGWEVIQNEKAGVEWQAGLLRNQAIMSGILGVGTDVGTSAVQQITAQLDDMKLGGSSVGELFILDNVGQMSFERIMMTAVEAGLIDSRKLTRQDVASLFQVPLPVLGYLEDATLANIETSRKIFWQDTLVPFGTKLAETLTQQLAVPEFGEEWVIDFDYDSIPALKSNMMESLEQFKALRALGVKINVASEMADLGLTEDDFEEAAEPLEPERKEITE